MKILLITDNHTPTGGAENYFFDLKNQLQKLPELKVQSLGFGSHAENGQDYTVIATAQSGIAKIFSRLFFNPFIFFKLRRTIRKFAPDLIHIHNVKQHFPAIVRAIHSYPIVQTVHDYGAVCPVGFNIHKDFTPCPTGVRKECFWQHQVKHNRLIYLLSTINFLSNRRRIKKTVKKFFAPSPMLVNMLQQNEFSNVVHVPPFIKSPRGVSFSQMQPNVFFFAGNLGTHKGIHLLLDEFAIACAQQKNLLLLVAGIGPEAKRLQAKVLQLGIQKNVVFLGWQAALEQFYTLSAAIIFPSIWTEAFGLVISEAMSYARPVIGSNRGSPPWLIEANETGLIFDPSIKGDLAANILCLAENPSLCKKMGLRGYEKLYREFDNSQTVGKILSEYRDCLNLQ